ncbi:IAA-amino acid conjugate hydrolase [Aureococcus anophagefferens]|uniref:IAA-amino acid conjugate hydrolase n=1 Tax=Aureococcus anophagefferens TaxID=44056 RepID=A0ABR1FJ22_AURAN
MLAALLAIGCAVADDVPVVVLRTPAAAKMAAPSFEELWNDAGDHMPWVVETRRELHRMPELLFDEHMTSGKIASVLASLGVNFTTGWAVNTKREELAAKGFASGAGGTGIVAEIGSGGEPCVLLRSDIDALPIHETAPVPWRSEIDGRMHACGHDGHAAMLLGAAAVLKRREADIVGTVRLVFQPAEEGGAGGKRMVEEGALKRFPPVRAAFGFHQWPFLPLGVIGGRPGPMLAATELFDVLVSGVGGHAAMRVGPRPPTREGRARPHHVVDPIVAAAHVVTALQSIASRETDPLSSAVVSVTMFHAGDAYNVIPAGARVGGTIRSLSFDGLRRVKDRVDAVVLATAAAHRCNASVSWSPDAYPATVNDPELWEWSARVAAAASVEGEVRTIDPTMGGEDFSFIADEVPSTFLALGQGATDFETTDDDGAPVGPFDTTVTVHNGRFVLHEDLLRRGVALHAHLALNYLADQK